MTSELEKGMNILANYEEAIIETTQTRQTMNLRWNGPVLEQEFLVITYRNSRFKADEEHSEWRPVPSVEAADPLPQVAAILSEGDAGVYAISPEDMSGLCQDEGCPHHGTPHICIDVKAEQLARLESQSTMFNPAEGSPATQAQMALLFTQKGTREQQHEAVDWMHGWKEIE